MYKFPKIQQFRQFVRRARDRAQYVGDGPDGEAVYDRTLPLPTLTVSGSTKLHGTNGGIVFHEDGRVTAQSRNRELTVDDDNMGFALHVHQWEHHLDAHRDLADSVTVVYGEWCGQGVQKGVAISEMPKRFAPFAVWGDVTGWRRPTGWLQAVQERWSLQVDLARPEEAQARMVELVAQVEACCPYAAREGIEGVGEGIVWWCDSPGFEGPDFWFKAKGEKHSATRVKKLAPIDTELVARVRAFAEATVTARRLEQGFEHLREMKLPEDRTSTGAFIKWVVSDILSEEVDTLEATGLTKRDVGKALSTAAREGFFRSLDEWAA